MEIEKLIIICPLILISGILDAIVGGGALISLPTYIAAGLPTHYAYGTNKFASFLGTFTSAVRYVKDRRFDIKSVFMFAIMCVLNKGKIKRIIFATVDKSPHCVQVHYIREQLEKMMNLENVIMENYVVVDNELIKIEPETIALSKNLKELLS